MGLGMRDAYVRTAAARSSAAALSARWPSVRIAPPQTLT